MSEQLPRPASSQQRVLPWYVRLCQRLWKMILSLGLGSIFIGLAGNLFATWLTSSKGVIPPDSPWMGFLTMLWAYWLIALLIGCCLLLCGALIWAISRWGSRDTITPLRPLTPTAQDRVRMLKRLRFRYEQMLAQSLQGAVQIELGLASRSAAVQQAASLALRLPNLPDQPLPAHASIVDIYEQAQQELLILGEPGAGKSTLLLELAHHLTQQAEADRDQPLPVLLPLSSWAVKQPALQDWLVEQIAALYDVPRRLSQGWVETGQVTPLLDGLDEMEERARPACIAAINTYHREHLEPLVICSRTAEYERAAHHERLALHTAVIVQPLSPVQVDAHLTSLGKPFTGLRTALKKNTALAELATTPLLLQVLLLTYHGTSIRQLSRKESQLRTQIWTDYIERTGEHKGNAQRYSRQASIAWLGWLATTLRQRNLTIFSLESLQPEWLPGRYRRLSRWSIMLVFGLVVGLVAGLAAGLVARSYSGLVVGLVAGLLFGLVAGLGRLLTKIEPAEMLTWSWKGFKSELRGWLAVGLAAESLVGLFSGLFSGLAGGLVVGLLGGLLIGLLGGLSGKQLTERLLLAPNEGIRRSAKNGLLFGLLVGSFVGLVGGLSGGLLFGLIGGLVGGPLVGLVAGLLFGLFGGLGNAGSHYIMRFWLWQSGLFPWNAVTFLEDATARILLRRVGNGYQFTHRLLLDYFADTYEATSPTPAVPPTQSTPPPSP